MKARNNAGLRVVKILQSARRFASFFLIISFTVTCCMTLFLITFQQTARVELTEENITLAAKLTFGNVILISLLFTIIDEIRRWFMVTRPVKHIIAAAEKITDGDFSVQISKIRGGDEFNLIIDYFNRMARELSGIETLRTDFIANVSHELKTPLAVIQNYGTMLQTLDLSDEKRLLYAKIITNSSRRLADLITNILKLNRLENQQIFPQKKLYDLGEQLCGSLLNFEKIWEEKRIEISTEIADEVLIESDFELLELVWSNLFSNALKFTETGGKVALSMHADGEFAVVKISDTGCGISPETGRHIFEKFYQGDTSHAAQGNGLGLALVKRIMDIIGGEISVQSEVGRGSTFTVKLRRKSNDAN